MGDIVENTAQRKDAPELKIPLVVSPWLRELLVDPVSKKAFVESGPDGFLAPSGLKYRYVGGVPDFRISLAKGAQEWLDGQVAFEEWIDGYLRKGEVDPDFYRREQSGDAPIYQALKLEGRVLDVGGLLGAIRKYMAPDQEYCSMDPFISAVEKVRGRKNYFASYPMGSPLNLVGGFAEFLPFKDASFDTVNMRSCIDHFYNPEIALLEAFRVLKEGGKLIVGISLHGRTLKSKAIEAAKEIVGVVVPRYRDHHIWHPSHEGLIALCASCGFDVEREVWQSPDVIYASFRRRKTHAVSSV